MKLKTKTQNIFCCLNENLTNFLYTLTGVAKGEKKRFSLSKCVQKSNAMTMAILEEDILFFCNAILTEWFVEYVAVYIL